MAEAAGIKKPPIKKIAAANSEIFLILVNELVNKDLFIFTVNKCVNRRLLIILHPTGKPRVLSSPSLCAGNFGNNRRGGSSYCKLFPCLPKLTGGSLIGDQQVATISSNIQTSFTLTALKTGDFSSHMIALPSLLLYELISLLCAVIKTMLAISLYNCLCRPYMNVLCILAMYERIFHYYHPPPTKFAFFILNRLNRIIDHPFLGFILITK